MSVNTFITNLASNLVLSDLERTSISTSIGTLSARLASHFGTEIKDKFQFGSSTRGTILPRKADSESDIDHMIVFNTAAGIKKPQTYLDRLKRFAETKYATSEISQSNPTIILSLGHIDFELVPAIDNFGYQIPSPASSWAEWIATNPAGANKVLQEKNLANNSLVKPLVRLVKYWNAKNGHPFYSFLLEQHIVNENFWNCTSLRDYFYYFWNSINCPYSAPQSTKDKVDRAKEQAKKAKAFEDSGLSDAGELEIKKMAPAL